MRSLTLPGETPDFHELHAALVEASEEMLPFAIVCCGDPLRAESYLLDALLISLENSWFTRAVSVSERFSYLEFRQEIYRLLWQRIANDSLAGVVAGVRTYGESSARFYRLDLYERAALFLRTKLKFEYSQIAYVLGEDTIDVAIARVHGAREKILGKELLRGADV